MMTEANIKKKKSRVSPKGPPLSRNSEVVLAIEVPTQRVVSCRLKKLL